MRKKTEVEHAVGYTVDLTEIEGGGAFPCPKCGAIISPDDESEEVYTIVETEVEDDQLTELILKCNRCESQIRLTGFLSLGKVASK